MRFTFSKTSRRLATAVAAIGVAGVMLAGCAAATPGDGGDKGGSITVIPKSLGNKYFEASDKGAKAAAD
ncbi:MAG: rhamnose ABC transporter substrate-binding protein, partial [Pseudolysinimonas sp.]